jgi:hypothetical protein
MAKGKPEPQWQEKVRAWEASGESASTWCKENKISVNTFSGWKKRLKKFNVNSDRAESEFIELKDRVQSDSGITLEYNEIKIHLRDKFDKTVLRQCLDCLRDTLC